MNIACQLFDYCDLLYFDQSLNIIQLITYINLYAIMLMLVVATILKIIRWWSFGIFTRSGQL